MNHRAAFDSRQNPVATAVGRCYYWLGTRKAKNSSRHDSPAGNMTSSSVGFASALSRLSSTTDALHEAAAAALDQLGRQADFGVIFFSQNHRDQAEAVAAEAATLLGPAQLIGCSAESVAGVGCEVERAPALSLWLAALPGARITTMRLEFRRTADGHVIAGWPEGLAGVWPGDSFLIALGEPYSFPFDAVLEQLNQDRPGAPIMGGMASGASIPGGNRLILGSNAYREGAVVAHVSGGVRLLPIVSQGCRPVGKPFVVTKAERNVVYQLGGRPALDQLREIFQTLPTSEQQLVNRGLHLGRVVDEYRDHFDHGDFLVRNVIGGDANTGAIAVGDYIRTGQTVQFHIRDAASADAELRQLLADVRDQPASGPRGALLFTCNGRGTHLFSQPHHDAGAIQQVLGNIPLAGLFAQGEIGPVAGRNFLHGFTASIAVLEGT